VATTLVTGSGNINFPKAKNGTKPTTRHIRKHYPGPSPKPHPIPTRKPLPTASLKPGTVPVVESMTKEFWEMIAKEANMTLKEVWEDGPQESGT
jgi:hypothetical protein